MRQIKFFLATSATIICLFFCVAFAQSQEKSSPAVVSAVAPVYPAVAIALNVEGDFQVDVEIDRNGKVTSSKAVEGTNKHIVGVIEAAADRWKFTPDKNGEKKRFARLTFTFHYTPNEAGIDSTPVFYPPYKIEVREHIVIVSN